MAALVCLIKDNGVLRGRPAKNSSEAGRRGYAGECAALTGPTST